MRWVVVVAVLCLAPAVQARSVEVARGGILGDGQGCDRAALPTGDERNIKQLDAVIVDCGKRLRTCEERFQPSELRLCQATYMSQRGRAYLLLAMAQSPGRITARQRGLVLTAIAQLDRAIAVSPSPGLTAFYLHYRATAYTFAEMWREAARDLDRAEVESEKTGTPEQIQQFRDIIRPLRDILAPLVDR